MASSLKMISQPYSITCLLSRQKKSKRKASLLRKVVGHLTTQRDLRLLKRCIKYSTCALEISSV